MPQYLGVDFGGSMIKVATCESAEATPSTLSLTDDDPFIPAAVQVGASANDLVLGWDAYRHRRRAGLGTITHLRDELASPDSRLFVQGASFEGISLGVELLLHTGHAIQSRVSDAAGLAFAVPDIWTNSHWSLPIALERAGWTPKIYVREWSAVLSLQSGLSSENIAMLSLGSSAARAAACTIRDGCWQVLATRSSSDVSGIALRKQLVNKFAEEVIRRTRRDPREDIEADQLLHDLIDSAMMQLQRGNDASLQAEFFGQTFDRSISRDELVAGAQLFQGSLYKLMDDLLADPLVRAGSCAIVAWGELALLLPLAQWIGGFCPRSGSIVCASLDVVAAGAARLCALAADTDVDSNPDEFGSLCPCCGAFTSKWCGVTCGGCGGSLTALWERPSFPDWLSPASAPARACLVLVGSGSDEQRVRLSGERFRLGRHPLSEWVFPLEQYPTVSGAHAVIIRDGASYVLTDLNSTNGTFINETRVQRCVLNSGDEIRLGREGPRLRFEPLSDN